MTMTEGWPLGIGWLLFAGMLSFLLLVLLRGRR